MRSTSSRRIWRTTGATGATASGWPSVLDALVAETRFPWIRMLYLYSAGLTDRLLDCWRANRAWCKYLDMPIQHGSDRRAAAHAPPGARGDDPARPSSVCAKRYPDVAIRTTCIVGFPGETEDDFQRLLDLLEETQFDRVGVFTYSAQTAHAPTEMADDVPDAVKLERLERLTEHQRLITGERYEARVGTIAHAIIDRPVDRPDADMPWASGGARSRLSCQADDIDGSTYLVRHDLPPGTIAQVHVDGVVDDYDFRATVHAS